MSLTPLLPPGPAVALLGLCALLPAGPALGQATPEDVAVLEAELAALRARLERLEKRVEACEARTAAEPPAPAAPRAPEAAPEAAALPAPPPEGPEDPADAPAVRAERPPRLQVPVTGQTLADKVRFLEARCRDVDPCVGRLLSRKPLLRTMTIDQVRKFSSSVTRCAHSCAVDLAVQAASADRGPRAPPPDEAVGLRPAGSRGLPGYPGRSAPLDELQRFLDVRCGDLHCARLPLRSQAAENPALESFVRTCAEACAQTRERSPAPSPP